MSSRELREILEHVTKVAAMEEQVAALEHKNAKLRELLRRLDVEHWQQVGKLKAENAKLRELVRDMWRDGMCECDERGACAGCEYHYHERMRELGVEVEG